MKITGTVLCETSQQREEVANKLKTILGTTITESDLAIAIDYEPTDFMTTFEDNRSILQLIDVIESVKVHGLVMSP